MAPLYGISYGVALLVWLAALGPVQEGSPYPRALQSQQRQAAITVITATTATTAIKASAPILDGLAPTAARQRQAQAHN